MIISDLAEQDVPGVTLECDDPGDVEKGDITYCRGADEDGNKITLNATFDGDGGYSWETL